MKKINFILSFLFFVTVLNAQNEELLVGGDMESGDAWTVLDVSENDPFVTSTDVSRFGYTVDGPSDGENGCFHSSTTPTTQVLSTAVYQKVTINKGEKYIFSMAYKNPKIMQAAWMEAFYSEYEPTENVDWVPDSEPNDSVFKILGYTGTDWGGAADSYDETASGVVMIAGTGTVDIYIGFKYGQGWGGEIEYEYTIDNVSLKTLPAVGIGENITGGDMESGDAWTVLDVSENDPFITSTDVSRFGYTVDGPADGKDGCFQSSTTPTSQVLSTAVYQKVTIKKGVPYEFSLAYKNPKIMQAAWFEGFYSQYEPQVNLDWVPDNAPVDSVFKMFGYTGTDWGGAADSYDETVKYILYEHGEGTMDIYIGFKYGQGWGGEIEYEYTVDNVSLIGGSTVGVSHESTNNSLNVYPNPANKSITIEGAETDNIHIYNLLGVEVYSSIATERMTVDISSFEKGVYIVRADNSTSVFIKK